MKIEERGCPTLELMYAFLSFSILIVLGTVLHLLFPKVPLPLYLIGLGAVLSWVPIPVVFQFEPEVFLICLIAPILFGDAQNISRRDLWEYRKPILLMALGLVIFAVVGIGYFIHLLLPAMPLAAAFALAAVLSPTDAVAVQSMTRGKKFPEGLMLILEGESLLNDAAGLVSFKVALGVVMTGVFSLGGATRNFVFVSIGGLLVGIVLGILVVNFRLFLRKRGLEEVHSLVVILLMTPFLIYIIAEELHVSGILAVVIAGIIHGVERDRLKQTSTKLQITTSNTWSVFSYVLNGFVFVLLGFLLPDVIQGLLVSREVSILTAVLLAFTIFIALFVARFGWVYLLFEKFIAPSRKKNGSSSLPTRISYAFAASVCGVHGTITLATALSTPYLLTSGAPFPLRNTILFIAASVILISLLVATFIIPILGVKADEGITDSVLLSRKEASSQMLHQVIQQLTAEIEPDNRRATAVIIRQLEEQLRDVQHGSIKLSESAIREFQQIGRVAQEEKLEELIRDDVISPELKMIYPMLVQERQSFGFWGRIKFMLMRRRLNQVYLKMKASNEVRVTRLVEEYKSIEKQLQLAAVVAIKKQTRPEHRLESLLVIHHYPKIIKEHEYGKDDEQFMQQVKQIQMRNIQIKRDEIQLLDDDKQITSATKLDMLQVVNYEEILMLENGHG
ncbi:Na+/H+ antiporter [Paenibacillus radicibacter]|uniref:Na+/H+ antiporter n=1 Tax=Paenibacillus radicibacter TaxID=2972488 RepID=UPI002158C7AB|nr:Na+/H+ antiporter [Paenibacillus radicibacter]